MRHWMLGLLASVVTMASPLCAGAQRAAPSSGMVTVNGVQLFHEVHGEGPPLVLIEGLGASLWLWEKQLPELARHFRVVAFDNRGVGRSEAPEGPYTIAQLADDVAGLLDALGIKRAHVLGFSMGGFVAQEFALRYPERVDRLVLAATSAGGATHVPMSQEALARFMAPGGDTPRDWVRNRLPLAYTEEYLRDSARVEQMIDFRMEHPQRPHAYQAQVAAGMGFDRAADVERIQAPTLILAASDDQMVPVANAHHLAERIPNSRLVVYEGLGHQFNVEGHERFNRDVIEFLTGSR